MNQYNDKKIFILNTNAHKAIYYMIVLIFFSFIKYIKCQEIIFNLTCNFPHYLLLNNGNYLLYCSKGIFLYNNQFDKILSNNTFDIEVQNIDEAKYTIIEQFSDDEGGNIIVLGKNLFYYFDSEGGFIFKSNFTLTDNSVDYYTIVPYKSKNDNNFILGIFESSNQIILYNFKINPIAKEITQINEIRPNIKNSKNWSPTFFYGIECKRMKYSSYNNILICFLADTSIGELCSIAFDLDNNFEEINDLNIKHFQGLRPKYFKVIISQNKTLALICFRSMTNMEGNCTYFNTNSSSFSEEKQFITKCGDKPYNSIITYVKNTQETIFSCVDGNILRLTKFDKNLNYIDIPNNDNSIQPTNCSNIYFHGILHLNQYKNYIFISDTDRMGGHFTLLPDKYNPDLSFLISTILKVPQTTSFTFLVNQMPVSNDISIISTKISTISKPSIPFNPPHISSSLFSISTTLVNVQPTTSPHSISTTLINIQSTTFPSISTTLINIQLTTSPSISTTLINMQLTTSLNKGQSSLIDRQSISSQKTISTSLTKTQSTFSQHSIPTTLIKAQTTYLSSSPNISPSTSISTLLSTYLSSSPFISRSSSLTNPTSLNISPAPLISSLIYSSNSIITSSSNIISSNISTPSSLFHQSNIISTIQESDVKITEVLEDICDPDYFYKNILTNKCQKVCNFDEYINEICYIIDLNENNILNITQDIRNFIKLLNITKSTNSVIKGNNALYQIISSEAKNQNKNKNISIIDFSKCEEILKKTEKIDYILILKVDIHLSNSTNIVLKYEAYNPYTLKKLNLSICNKVKINTFVPYSLTGKYIDLYPKLNELGYDLNNPNDNFYNDICCPFTPENKTDILLYDRKMNYYKNTTFCEEGCTYKEYDYTERKVKCECIIKTEFDKDIDNIQFYSNLVLNTFFKIDHFSNIKVLKCYKLVFSKLGQEKNYGSCIFLFILAVYIILMIFFYLNFKSEVLSIFNTIIEKKYKNPVSAPIKNKYNRKTKKHGSCMIPKSKINELVSGKIVSNDSLKIHIKNLKSKFDKLNFKIKKERKNSINNSSKEIFNSKNKSSTFSVSDKIFKFNNKMSTLKNDIANHKSKNKNKVKKINSLLYKFSNDELNSLKYEDAIEFDKRTYIEYYMSLIRQKQLIIFSFFNKNDYNLFSIKLSLFLFSFSLYFTVNTLFFTDETMHKIYENQGLLEYYFYLLHIIYSTFISAFITLILKTLALSNKNMLKIKRIKDKRNALMESVKLIKTLNVRFSIYYIISFILLIFFWYFISAFCAVYKNTQIILFENTLSSFALSLLYPFGLYLLPGMFRIPALRAKSKDKKCLYVFSNLLSYI